MQTITVSPSATGTHQGPRGTCSPLALLRIARPEALRLCIQTGILDARRLLRAEGVVLGVVYVQGRHVRTHRSVRYVYPVLLSGLFKGGRAPDLPKPGSQAGPSPHWHSRPRRARIGASRHQWRRGRLANEAPAVTVGHLQVARWQVATKAPGAQFGRFAAGPPFKLARLCTLLPPGVALSGQQHPRSALAGRASNLRAPLQG